MSMLRRTGKTTATRPSLLVTLKISTKPATREMTEEEAWYYLQEAFKDHPTLSIEQALFQPDKHSEILNNEK